MSALRGVTAAVTGAAQGIGHAIAQELERRGAAVARLDVREGADIIHCDVTDEGSVRSALARTIQTLGGLDVLVNNAGILIEKSLLETTAQDFDTVIAVNLRGPFLLSKEFVQYLQHNRRERTPRIINIASELAHLGREDYVPYCASKGGVISMTRSLARELAPTVLVNAVAPGPTDTPMLEAERQYAELKETADGIPLGRLGLPQDIARAVAFLASTDADFMTGSVVDVNGGAAMY